VAAVLTGASETAKNVGEIVQGIAETVSEVAQIFRAPEERLAPAVVIPHWHRGAVPPDRQEPPTQSRGETTKR
jgi:hypothetical protein